MPRGVVGVISPFNFPLILSMRAVAPALATGNAVVLIPLVNSWESLIGSLDKFTKDYMADRAQAKQQKREAVFE